MTAGPLQLALDRLVRAPQWAGLALVAVSLIIVALGRFGQRPMNGLVLGGGAFAAAFFGLRGTHEMLPGIAGIVAGVLAAVFGVAAGAWGTACVLAALVGCIAFGLCKALSIDPLLGSVPAAAFGLLYGMTHRARIPVWLPPIASGILAALGAAIAFGPVWNGARFAQLNDVRWTLGLAAVLCVAFLAISLERDFRRRRKLAARTKAMDDDDLKKKLAAQRAGFERAHDIERADG